MRTSFDEFPRYNTWAYRYAEADEQFVRGHGDKFTLKRGAELAAFASAHEEALRHDPCLVAVLEEACLPPLTPAGAASGAALGTEQRWLEERKGVTMLRRSTSLLESHELGAVVALPGRAARTAVGPSGQNCGTPTNQVSNHTYLKVRYLKVWTYFVKSGPKIN